MTSTNDKSLTILVPLDGSSLALQAIPYADQLVGATGSVEFLTVLDGPQQVIDETGRRLPITDQDEERQREKARDYLSEVSAKWMPDRSDVHVDASYGDPADEILRQAHERGANVIAIASHGRGAVGRWRFGSVADRLTRMTTLPLLIIRPRDAEVEINHHKIDRLLIALDGSDRAQRSVPVVKAIAVHSHLPVHLTTVLPAADAMLLPVPWMGPPAAQDDMLDAFGEAREREGVNLGRIADELSEEGIDATWSIEVGDPFDELQKLAGDDAVIAITTHGRTGFDRWALGSLAEKLVRYASAPVLVNSARED